MRAITPAGRRAIFSNFQRAARLSTSSLPERYVETLALSFIERWDKRLQIATVVKFDRQPATTRQTAAQLRRFHAALDAFEGACDRLSRPAFDIINAALNAERNDDWGPFNEPDFFVLHAYYVRLLSNAVSTAEAQIEIGDPERSAPRKVMAHSVVAELANTYEDIVGKAPGVTVATDTSSAPVGTADGAFLDMVRAAFEAFHITASPKAMYDAYKADLHRSAEKSHRKRG